MNKIAIERCAGEVITEILDVVENFDPDEAQMQLVMRGNFDVFRIIMNYVTLMLTLFPIIACE